MKIPWKDKLSYLGSNETQEVTVFLKDGEYGYKTGNLLGKQYDNARVIEADESTRNRLDGIHSDCKEHRVNAAKLISKILNSN